jgi:hypothetical protein
MSEQQVRLSDKQAMACVEITKFSTFIGGDWSALGCCCEKRKGKEVFYMHKTTKKVKKTKL